MAEASRTRADAAPRRRFLKASVASLAARLVAGSGGGLALASAARAQGVFTPDGALQEMMAGNRRFVASGMTSFNDDLAILKEKTAEKQEPFAAVLSCADSRVPVEIVFDQSIGHLFVVRVAGNVASSLMIASLEYGAAVLGTKVIMVLGHGSCGAVKATIEGQPVPGQISALYSYIRPAVDRAGRDTDAASKANASLQATLLRESSPVIAEAVKSGKLKVVAAFYDLVSGRVSLLD